MNRIVLFSVCGLALAGPTAAAAKDRPVSDHDHTITTTPLQLASPTVMLDYEKRVSERIGVSAGAGYGRYNSLWLRIANSAAEAAGGEYAIQQVAGSTGVHLYFRDFNRGWFSGLGLEYVRYTPRLESEGSETDTAESFSNIRIGPTLGYKIASKKGFTFSMEMGMGYSMVTGDTAGSIAPAISESGLRGLGNVKLGWSF